MAEPGCETPEAMGKRMIREAGYADGGHVKHPDEAQDRTLIKSMLGKARIKASNGGKVEGKKVADRPDRAKRADGGGVAEKEHEKLKVDDIGRARGGETPKHDKGKSKGPAININVGKGGGAGAPAAGGQDQQAIMMAEKAGEQRGMQAGAQLGARAAMGGAGGPPRPPMAGPPPGAGMPPPGGPAGAPPGAMPPRPMMPPGAGGPPPMGAKDGGHIKVKAHERRKAGGVV